MLQGEDILTILRGSDIIIIMLCGSDIVTVIIITIGVAESEVK